MTEQVNDPAKKKILLDGLQEISHSKSRMGAERDLVKEIVNKLHEETAIEKKIIRRLAKVFHASNFTEEVAADEEFEILYSNLTGERAE